MEFIYVVLVIIGFISLSFGVFTLASRNKFDKEYMNNLTWFRKIVTQLCAFNAYAQHGHPLCLSYRFIKDCCEVNEGSHALSIKEIQSAIDEAIYLRLMITESSIDKFMEDKLDVRNRYKMDEFLSLSKRERSRLLNRWMSASGY